MLHLAYLSLPTRRRSQCPQFQWCQGRSRSTVLHGIFQAKPKPTAKPGTCNPSTGITSALSQSTHVQSSQERDGFGLFFLPTPTLSIREMFQKLISQTEQKLPSNFHPNEFMASLYPFSLNASVALFFPFFIF